MTSITEELDNLFSKLEITAEEYASYKNNLKLTLYDAQKLLKVINFPSELSNKILEENSSLLSDNNEKLKLSYKKIYSFIKSTLDTNDQQFAYKLLSKFLCDSKKNLFCLQGYAGTGKTHTLMNLVLKLIKLNAFKSFALVAPTNKAVSVMKAKFKEHIEKSYSVTYDEVITSFETALVNVQFLTLHQLLKIKSDFAADGTMVWINSTSTNITSYDLIIIDECSMIPINIVEQILTNIKGQTNIKVILSGDPAQLPPLNETQSAVFRYNNPITFMEYKIALKQLDPSIQSFSKESYKEFIKELQSIESFVMKQVMRTSNQDVMNVCLEIRNWVSNNESSPDLSPYVASDNVSIFDHELKTKFQEKWFKICLGEFQKKVNNTIILCWTNSQANSYNEYIRKNIFDVNSPKKYEVGDILILNNFYNFKSSSNSKILFNKNVGYTSEQLKVIKISIYKKKISLCESPHMNQIEENLKKSPYEKILSKFNDFKEDMKSMKIEFKSYELTVEKIGSEQSDLYKLYTMHDDSAQLYSKQKNMIQTIIKNFIMSISTDKHIEKFLSSNLTKYVWKDYYENMIEPFADVSYGYAITCHKAQGSNFYNVFVDANDIFKNNKLDEMKKCLYTAFSRTQNKLYILI
jgi:superfamily II DNA or RNA helicase